MMSKYFFFKKLVIIIFSASFMASCLPTHIVDERSNQSTESLVDSDYQPLVESESFTSKNFDNLNFRVFSPAKAQADYYQYHQQSFKPLWDELAPYFDVFNLHAYDIVRGKTESYSDSRLSGIIGHLKRNGQALMLESQSTTGFAMEFANFASGSPGSGGLNSLPTQHACREKDLAYTCGEIAAALLHKHVYSRIEAVSKGVISHILLDSTFYSSYYTFDYATGAGAVHSNVAKIRAIQFLDGFAAKIKSSAYLPGVKLIFLSHFKYESVGGKPGLPRNIGGTEYSNTAQGNGDVWIEEDDMVKFVFQNVKPKTFDRIMFDASWSSFYDTVDGFPRWNLMLTAARTVSDLPIAMIVHSDSRVGSGVREEWYHDRPENKPNHLNRIPTKEHCNASEAKMWQDHNLSYIDTIRTGAKGLLPMHKVIDGVMVATWHQYPPSAFDLSKISHFAAKACEFPLAEILMKADLGGGSRDRQEKVLTPIIASYLTH